MCRRDGPVQLPLRQVMNQVPPMLLQRIRRNGGRCYPCTSWSKVLRSLGSSQFTFLSQLLIIQLHSALWLRSIPRTHYDESAQFTTHPANTAQHKLFAQAVLGEGQLHAQAVVGEGHRKRVSTHTSKCFNVIPYHRTTRGALKAALVPGVQSGLEPAHPEADYPSRNFAKKGKSWLLAHISPNSGLHKINASWQHPQSHCSVTACRATSGYS